VKIGDMVINVANYQVTVNGQPIELTYKEYELLKFLATHRGRVYSREVLLERVWGEEYFGGTRTVDVHIRRLRAKLPHPTTNMIETVRNVGYRFQG
jgi:DNA-binding response OmpR family regulator